MGCPFPNIRTHLTHSDSPEDLREIRDSQHHTSPTEYILGWGLDMRTSKSLQLIGNARDRGACEMTPWDAVSKFQNRAGGQSCDVFTNKLQRCTFGHDGRQVNTTLTSPQYYIKATTKLQNSLLLENSLKTSEAEVLCN